ncbi:unnamed protein product [Phytophthora fragariaefolia]|uniref:Unnamed protein product n=1 Tax=Phytophthora fragariaefolia TaxID=1490495 RepID=A0A9W6U8X7_9STRA|nr:unnamed protein product [Phytophthora fragariaefolia]
MAIQGEQRLHRTGGNAKRNNDQDNARHSNRRGNSGGQRNSRSHQPRGGNRGRGRGYNNNRENNNSNNSINNNKHCIFHRTTTHNTQDCRALRQDNQHEEHQQAGSNRGRNEAHHARGRGSGDHRPPQTRVEHRSQRSDESSDEKYMFVGLNYMPTVTPHRMRIMVKLEHGKDRYHALLDSGCSRSIIRTDFMQALQAQGGTLQSSRVSFDPVTGSTASGGAMTVRFRIPGLKRDSVIIHTFEVLPSLRDEMVIGRELMAALGLVIDLRAGIVQWDGSETKIKTGEDDMSASTARGLVVVNEDEADELFAGDENEV